MLGVSADYRLTINLLLDPFGDNSSREAFTGHCGISTHTSPPRQSHATKLAQALPIRQPHLAAQTRCISTLSKARYQAAAPFGSPNKNPSKSCLDPRIPSYRRRPCNTNVPLTTKTMSSPIIPTNSSTSHKFLVLLPTTHTTFDASASTSSAITETISASLPSEEKLQRSSSITSEASATSDNGVVGRVANAEPAPLVTLVRKDEYLRLGNGAGF